MRRWELIIALGFAMAWPIAANGQDARALHSQIILMQAECIADKLAEFMKQIQNQVGWTTQSAIDGRLHRAASVRRAAASAPGSCYYRAVATRC
jgi:hypothetical protein